MKRAMRDNLTYRSMTMMASSPGKSGTSYMAIKKQIIDR